MPRLSEFDYHLPEHLIAQKPLTDRTASRLLCLNKFTGAIEDKKFADLADLLQPEDLVVMNNTRVTALRLLGNKLNSTDGTGTGAKAEALLLREIGPGTYECLVKPAKRLRAGVAIEFPSGLRATVSEVLPDGMRVLVFDEVPDLADKIGSAGTIPLPPYIVSELDDPERYQTVVATQAGSAAAPTAALHFTAEFIASIKRKGTTFAEVTLDIGMDTFRPVTSESLDDHVMHGEQCSVSEETVDKIRNCKGRIVAVGTTVVRTLESFATGPRTVASGSKTTTIFVQPGYQFKVVDAILTNFHMPKTTMLVMIAAMTDRNHLLEAYRHAVTSRYRFLSFGDAMFIS